MVNFEDPSTSKALFFMLAGCSVLAQLFILVSYIGIRRRSSIFNSQIVWFITTNMISFVAFFYTAGLDSISDPDLGCQTFGFIHQFFHVSSILWSSIIIFNTLTSLQQQKRIQRIGIKLIIFVETLSFLSACYPIITNSYGDYNGFPFSLCWIKESTVWDIIIAYWIPLLSSLSFNLICYTIIIASIMKNYSRAVSKDFSLLFMFPLIQMITNTGSLIFHLTAGDYNLSPVAQVFHILLRSCEGILYLIPYASNYNIRRDISKVCLNRKYANTSLDSTLSMAFQGGVPKPKQSISSSRAECLDL